MISARVLNRTLLQRQLLTERVQRSALEMTEHLLGLQAQDVLPPYISLAARIEDFDPQELSDLLADRRAVRITLLRGTIHLVSAADCLELRPLVQPMLDKVTPTTDFGKRVDLPYDELTTAGRRLLDAGPLTPKELGAALVETYPAHKPGDLANVVRMKLPLVQVPPRGQWKQSGGQRYESAERWLGAPLTTEPDITEVVRRYLRAFGPATAADITVWSRITGIRAVLDGMADELTTYQDEFGRTLVDLENLPLADPDLPAPVRLLGHYDNVWLSHDDRTRVAEPDKRRGWMGRNGGMASTIFVDGYLEGLWRPVDGRVEIVDLFRRLTGAEQRELDAEVAGVEKLLAR